ncbi:MAG TPA: hypothetical protein VF240_05140 [Pyrinomonadaceae bacterium]
MKPDFPVWARGRRRRRRGAALAAAVVVSLLRAHAVCAQEGAHARGAVPDKLWQGLQGPVKTVRTEEFRVEMKDGREVSRRVNTKTDNYDAKGFMTESFDGDEPEAARFVYRQDVRGRPVETTLYLGGLRFGRDTHSYEASGRRVESHSYDSGGRLRKREVTTLDERGNDVRREIEHFDEDGKLTGEKSVLVYAYTYDVGGRLTESTSGDERGRLSDKYVSVYDASGRRTASTTYSYDQQSRALLTKTVFAYDARGDTVTVHAYDPRGALIYREAHAYEYDARGSWVTERRTTWHTEHAPASVTLIRRRTISYY